MWEKGFRKGKLIEPKKDMLHYVYYLIDNTIYCGTLNWKRTICNRLIPFQKVGLYAKIDGSKLAIHSNHVEIGDEKFTEKDCEKLKSYYVNFDDIENGISREFAIIKVDILDVSKQRSGKKVIISKEGSQLKDVYAWAEKDIEVELGRDKILFVELYQNKIGMTMVSMLGAILTENQDVKLNMSELNNDNEEW